jgi:cellulose synthase/poly-beta-1,6-N-acetylglucosamine synthase-like glycosyltransferase
VKWVFWGAAALVAYTFIGYPLWLWVRCRLRPRPIRKGRYTPRVSVVMVVRNEEKALAAKLENLLSLDYPGEKLGIVVVSDGSTDGTEEILRRYAQNPRIHAVMNQLPCGKASEINDAIAFCCGDVVVFTDARQKIEPGAMSLLLENLADPEVGCVSGELMLGDPESGQTAGGIGLYWRLEKKIREFESASGSVVGATGAFYAVRRELLGPIPEGTILDDVYIPMQVVRQARRVVFEPRARAWDVPDLGAGREYARKVRTLGGNYQLLQLAPWLLGGSNRIRFEFVSHKLLRLMAPFALLAILLATFWISGAFYRAVLIAQLGFYGLSALAPVRFPKHGPVARAADAAWTFVVLNTAAVVAFVRFVTGRTAAWGR